VLCASARGRAAARRGWGVEGQEGQNEFARGHGEHGARRGARLRNEEEICRLEGMRWRELEGF